MAVPRLTVVRPAGVVSLTARTVSQLSARRLDDPAGRSYHSITSHTLHADFATRLALVREEQAMVNRRVTGTRSRVIHLINPKTDSLTTRPLYLNRALYWRRAFRATATRWC